MSWLAFKLFLGRIPRAVWIALAVLTLLGLGSCVHNRKVEAYGREMFKAGVKAEVDRAEKARKEAEAKGNAISKKIRSETDANARTINSRADNERLLGPGLARCAVPPTAARRPEPASGNGDDPGSQVSEGDSAAVPWPWLVQRAEQADLNRNEVLAWREWHRRLTEEWLKNQK